MHWARLLWYDAPLACVVELPGVALPGVALRLAEPLDTQSGTFGQRLAAALDDEGWQMRACGSCAHWRGLATRTMDRLPTGRCTWAEGRHGGPHSPLVVQSLLALECSHWQPLAGGVEAGDTGRVESALPSGDSPSDTSWGLLNVGQSETLAPMVKAAEQESDERWSWWGRLREQVRRRSRNKARGEPHAIAPGTAKNAARQEAEAKGVSLGQPAAWEDKLVERSGVGAGTEPCFVCQGRIANLGALAVASPEGDKQTYSVWRCRHCYTYYLNDWIDRWERTDSLETEESYYRLAPQEALEILQVIDGVVDAEHPARRHEREGERTWMLQFLGERPKLSHQIKLGR